MNTIATLSLMLALACGTPVDPPAEEGAPRGAYPQGPYGKTEGSIIADLGFVRGDETHLSFGDIQADPSNRLLLLSTSAGWCTACIEEQPALTDLHHRYGPQGLFVLVTLFEDIEFRPADAELAASWSEQYRLPFSVVADPQFALGAYYDERLTPMNMLIEVPAMRILRITTGWDPAVVGAIIEAKL